MSKALIIAAYVMPLYMASITLALRASATQKVGAYIQLLGAVSFGLYLIIVIYASLERMRGVLGSTHAIIASIIYMFTIALGLAL